MSLRVRPHVLPVHVTAKYHLETCKYLVSCLIGACCTRRSSIMTRDQRNFCFKGAMLEESLNKTSPSLVNIEVYLLI